MKNHRTSDPTEPRDLEEVIASFDNARLIKKSLRKYR
jgi:hypothetical protein